MQNPMQKFRQNCIVFEESGFLSKKLKTLAISNYSRVELNIFCWNCAHVSHLPMSKKKCSDLFYFVYILSCWQKLKKACNKEYN